MTDVVEVGVVELDVAVVVGVELVEESVGIVEELTELVVELTAI